MSASMRFHFLFTFLRPGPPTVPRSGGFSSSPGQGKGKKKVYACTRLSLLSFLCRRTSSKMFVLAGKVKEEEKSVNVLVHHPMTGPMLLESHASQGWWGRCTRNCGSAKRQLPGSHFLIVRENAWARMLFPQSFFFLFSFTGPFYVLDRWGQCMKRRERRKRRLVV